MKTSSTLGKGLLLGGVLAFVGGFSILFTPVSNAWMTGVAWALALALNIAAVKVIARDNEEEESRRDFMMMQHMERFRQDALRKKAEEQGGVPQNFGPQSYPKPQVYSDNRKNTKSNKQTQQYGQQYSRQSSPQGQGQSGVRMNTERNNQRSQYNQEYQSQGAPNFQPSPSPTRPPQGGESEEERRERRRLQREEIRNRHRQPPQ